MRRISSLTRIQGTSFVLQGRYIVHRALKAFGGRERITMVTSFRPKNPLVKEESVLTGVRPVSDKSELYRQFTQYRLEVLIGRLQFVSGRLRQADGEDDGFDQDVIRRFLLEQNSYIIATLAELV